MRSLVSCKLLRLLVLVRRQQLAKSISRGFFIARHIYRNTWRETKTFKRAVKHISHHKHLNAGSIQVMELVFHECIGCIRHSYTQTKGNRYEICMCYYTVLRSSPSSLSPTITLPNWMKTLYTFYTQCGIHTNISQNSFCQPLPPSKAPCVYYSLSKKAMIFVDIQDKVLKITYQQLRIACWVRQIILL